MTIVFSVAFLFIYFGFFSFGTLVFWIFIIIIIIFLNGWISRGFQISKIIVFIFLQYRLSRSTFFTMFIFTLPLVRPFFDHFEYKINVYLIIQDNLLLIASAFTNFLVHYTFHLMFYSKTWNFLLYENYCYYEHMMLIQAFYRVGIVTVCGRHVNALTLCTGIDYNLWYCIEILLCIFVSLSINIWRQQMHQGCHNFHVIVII